MNPSRVLLTALALVAACDGAGVPPPSPPPSPSPSPTATATDTAPVIAAAGDIVCAPRTAAQSRDQMRLCGDRLTADLLAKGGYDAVLALGDLQYEAGALADFRRAYARSWGRFRSITYPVPGNHEYGTSRAAGYYAYFGPRAGDPARGYYSFDIGAWHLIALNSNCGAVGGCGVSSPQGRWLQRDLAAHRNTCTLAYWHHPRFSSGLHGSDDAYDGFWRLLYAAGADVVLTGHDHTYERFAPQTPAARLDEARGIASFIVGTGGRSRYPILTIRPNSRVRYTRVFGVLALTLHPTSYEWRFVAAVGTFTDAGRADCH
jgi:hypothetical protein